jgi:RNA polymerase sigma factor (sigma-70 family)
MADQDELSIFEEASPMLLGLAYRILGIRADAEDAVQDTYLKWQDADKSKIENPASWLTTICTRRCIDMLKAAHRSRVQYFGTWLPEPLVTPAVDRPDEQLDLAASLETAFLLLLERLTPKERAAYLLHDIFDLSYAEIAVTLEIQEATCRKLVSRARANIEQGKVRHHTPIDRQEQLLSAFKAAVESGDMAGLTGLLSDDVELLSDGGGKVSAVHHVLKGKAAVIRFVQLGLHRFWTGFEWVETELNGGRGAIIKQAGEVLATVGFSYGKDGEATSIYIVRNPDKLAGLN